MGTLRRRGEQLSDLLRVEWSELGRIGRGVLLALVITAGVATVLAIWIPGKVEAYVIDGEVHSLSLAVEHLKEEKALPPLPTPDAGEEIAKEVGEHFHLIGRGTRRVKVWLPDGTIVYSDAPELQGRTYPLSPDVRTALTGQAFARVPDIEQPDPVMADRPDDFREFYIPVTDDRGTVRAVFEVYEAADPLLAIVGDVQRYVQASLAVGVGALGALLAVLLFRVGLRLARQTRRAEHFVAELVRAQDEERRRIVGTLHDDIGQPLYRIHFGIEELRARLSNGHRTDPDLIESVTDELGRLDELVRDVDTHLRSELRFLTREPGPDVDLGTALTELACVTEQEAGFDIDLAVPADIHLPPAHRAMLYRACREALTNVRKHAYARHVTVRVEDRGGMVHLVVEDDGVGIHSPPGLGLSTLADRLGMVGGRLDVSRQRSGGTRVAASVPAYVAEAET